MIMTLFFNPNSKLLIINVILESRNFKRIIKNPWMQSRRFKLSMKWSRVSNKNNKKISNKYSKEFRKRTKKSKMILKRKT